MTSQNGPFKKILLPTDGSIHSLKAARYAAELAKICGSEVTLLHVLEILNEDHPIEIQTDSWIAPMKDEARIKEAAKKVMKKTKEVFNEDEMLVETRYFIYGHPSKAITEISEKENFDLIIMGSHGLSGIKRYIMGSVADKVCHNAPCPVLIVR